MRPRPPAPKAELLPRTVGRGCPNGAVVCVFSPDVMYAVGMWYANFAQTTDSEVLELLEESRTVAAQR